MRFTCVEPFAASPATDSVPGILQRVDFILTTRMVGKMQVENFYVPVSVILSKLDSVFAADVDVHSATRMVGFGVIGKFLRIIADGNEPVAQKPLLTAGKRFEKLNDLIVNEQTVVHGQLPDKPRRRSKSSSVANSEAGRSILSASFLR